MAKLGKSKAVFPKGVFVWREEEGTKDEWLAVGETLDDAACGLSAGQEREVAEYNFGYQGTAVVKADYVPGKSPRAK